MNFHLIKLKNYFNIFFFFIIVKLIYFIDTEVIFSNFSSTSLHFPLVKSKRTNYLMLIFSQYTRLSKKFHFSFFFFLFFFSSLLPLSLPYFLSSIYFFFFLSFFSSFFFHSTVSFPVHISSPNDWKHGPSATQNSDQRTRPQELSIIFSLI